MHYLIEFGVDRGVEAAEAELYSAIGGIALIQEDTRTAVYTSFLPISLSNAFKAYCDQHGLDKPKGRAFATAMVATFLDAMSGKIELPIAEDYTNIQRKPGIYTTAHPISEPDSFERYTFLHGTPFYSLVEQTYLATSIVPHLPPAAYTDFKRVFAERSKPSIAPKFFLDLDIIEN